jgi:AcrR family transcriptional regulator
MSDTRPPSHAAIFSAATQLFSEKGYAATSVRDIGAAAGVDPSLVIRHFGSKEQLFIDTMKLDLEHNPLMNVPLENLGESFIDFIATADDQVRGVFIALLRASDSGDIGSELRIAHEDAFVQPIKARLEGEDVELRARLAGALVGGLLYSLWVVGDETLAAADHRELVRRYGALLQALITPA